MTCRSRRSRALGWCWLMGGLTLIGCVGPKRGGPYGAAYALEGQRAGRHIVEQGETLYGLARRYGMTAAWLASYNDISEPSRLRIGQELRLPPVASVPAIATAATLDDVAPGAAPTLGGGHLASSVALVTVPASLGVSKETAAAPATEPNAAARSTVLAAPMPAPVAAAPLKAHVAAPAKLTDALTPGPLPPKSPQKLVLHWPVAGTVTSPFGRRKGRSHDGIDIGAPMGTQVRAAADGDVVFADTHRGYGNVVILRHVDGVMTIYAHHQKNLVLAGQRVRQGDPIAQVGSTGRASGPHLHFEVRQRAQPHDPLRFLPRTSS